MRALYHDDIAPSGPLNGLAKPTYKPLADRVDEAVEAQVKELGAFVTAEEVAEIRNREMAKTRNCVPFFDFTFSAAKSVSIVHASLVAAGSRAREAGDHLEAPGWRSGPRRSWPRCGIRPSTSWPPSRSGPPTPVPAMPGPSSVMPGASPPRPLSSGRARNGDPQLHVHTAVLNRVQRADGDDDRWRTLDSRSLHRERLLIGAFASRFLDQRLQQLGYALVARADGNGTEIGGVPQEVMDSFSSRRAAITPEVARLAREYEREHGHAPNGRALWSIRQFVTVQTRKTKHEVSRSAAEDLAVWTEQTRRAEVGALAEIHDLVSSFAAVQGPSAELAPEVRARAARIAVAEVQRNHAAWGLPHLIFELHRALPGFSRPALIRPGRSRILLRTSSLAG